MGRIRYSNKIGNGVFIPDGVSNPNFTGGPIATTGFVPNTDLSVTSALATVEIILKTGSIIDSNGIYCSHFSVHNTNSDGFTIINGDFGVPGVFFRASGGNPPSDSITVAHSSLMSANSWYHLVGVKTSPAIVQSSFDFYVNGISDNTKSGDGFSPVTTGRHVIVGGSTVNTGGRTARDCTIYRVRQWKDWAATSSDVQKMMSGIDPAFPSSSLVLDLDFNQTRGTTILDKSQSGLVFEANSSFDSLLGQPAGNYGSGLFVDEFGNIAV